MKTLEGYRFDRVIDKLGSYVKILPLGNKMFTLEADGADLNPFTNPSTAVLTIGLNTGIARFLRAFNGGHSFVCKKVYAKARNYEGNWAYIRID
jgi:hypothetical protein